MTHHIEILFKNKQVDGTSPNWNKKIIIETLSKIYTNDPRNYIQTIKKQIKNQVHNKFDTTVKFSSEIDQKGCTQKTITH